MSTSPSQCRELVEFLCVLLVYGIRPVGSGRQYPWNLSSRAKFIQPPLDLTKRTETQSWMGRKVGRFWKELGEGESMIKIYCMEKLIKN